MQRGVARRRSSSRCVTRAANRELRFGHASHASSAPSTGVRRSTARSRAHRNGDARPRRRCGGHRDGREPADRDRGWEPLADEQHDAVDVGMRTASSPAATRSAGPSATLSALPASAASAALTAHANDERARAAPDDRGDRTRADERETDERGDRRGEIAEQYRADADAVGEQQRGVIELGRERFDEVEGGDEQRDAREDDRAGCVDRAAYARHGRGGEEREHAHDPVEGPAQVAVPAPAPRRAANRAARPGAAARAGCATSPSRAGGAGARPCACPAATRRSASGSSSALRCRSGSSDVPPIATSAPTGTTTATAMPATMTSGRDETVQREERERRDPGRGRDPGVEVRVGDRGATTSTADACWRPAGERRRADGDRDRHPRTPRAMHAPASESAQRPGARVPDGRRAAAARPVAAPTTAPRRDGRAQLAARASGRSTRARGIGASRRYMTSGPSGASGAPLAPARSATQSANATMIDATPGA